MLLVLISLMLATILTSSYLASRDNSTAIGSNVASAAAARWVAESGMQFGIAVLQTQSTWRTSHVAGRLLSNFPLAGGTINLDLVDLETGGPPTATTEYVRLTTTATVAGVDQTAIADCHVPVSTQSEVDVDLSEFAVFAAQRLDMHNDATIARWPVAPLSALGERLLLATQATAASSIDLGDSAASVDTTVFHGPGASALLVAVAASQAPDSVALLDNIPMPAAPDSGVSAPLVISPWPALSQSTGNAITNVSTRWKSVTLSNTAVRTLRGNITATTDEDMNISNGGKLVIDGNVRVVVFGDLKLDAGSIELKSNATLTMFVRGRSATGFELRDGYIGNVRSDTSRDATGNSPYMDPERAMIFSMPGSSTDWRLRNNSVAKASIYAPDAHSFTIKDTSALYGRLASGNVVLADHGALFYDPALNDQVGYSNDKAAMWDNTDRLKTEFKTLASLDASALQAVADTVDLVLLGLTKTDTKHTPVSSTPSSPVAVAPTDPTPRPVIVQHTMLTFGNALDSWE
jgi:hypothetical protein